MQWERDRDKAETLAAAGDFSGYRALGYSEEEIARLKSAYDAAVGNGSNARTPAPYPDDGDRDLDEEMYRRSDLVNVPGYGFLPSEDVERLIKAGFMQVVGLDANGKPLVVPTTKQQTERIPITW